MSFRCQKTKKVVGNVDPTTKQMLGGISPVRVVTEVRKVTYENYNPKTKQTVRSEGYETVKELFLSPEAAKEYEGVSPKLNGNKLVVVKYIQREVAKDERE